MRHITRAEEEQIVNSILGERLPGAAEHPFFTQSLTPKYKIGSRKVSPGGWVWHYGRADAVGVTQTYRRRGVVSAIVDYNYKVRVSAPVGSYQVVINDTVHPVDYWAGGHASIFPEPRYLHDMQRMVKSSTASNGTSVTLTLYQPIDYALVGTLDGGDEDVYMVQSLYSEIREAVSAASPGHNSCVGWTYIPVTPLYYAWIHTWGICQSVHTGSKMGEDAGDRDVYFNHGDGTVRSGAAVVFGSCQRIGTIIPDTTLGQRPYFMLQLDP